MTAQPKKTGARKGTPLRPAFSSFQIKMLELLADRSPFGVKPTDVVVYLVSRELQKIYDENQYKVRDLINK